MHSGRYRRLLESDADAASWVWSALQLCEADFRETVLSAFLDWGRLGIVTSDLFEAITNLQRPSWGHWNFLLTSLRDVRKNRLRTGGLQERTAIEGADVLRDVLTLFDAPIEAEIAKQLKPLADFVRVQRPSKPRVSFLMTLPITLRNRIAHSPPTEAQDWSALAALLRPVLEYHARTCDQVGAVVGRKGYPSPWFVIDGKELWSFNGFHSDESINFVGSRGHLQADDDFSPNALSGSKDGGQLLAHEVFQEFSRLLGKADVQETGFKDLLKKLAPEEHRGVLLGDYFVGRTIGEGGFATVHIGWQLSTDRKVAVKILRDGLDDDAKLRFRQEARLLSEIRHPHIVFVYGIHEEAWSAPKKYSLDDEPWYQQFKQSSPVKTFIVMEWIDGRTIDDHIRSPERLPLVEMAEWFRQAAEALEAVHLTNIIHRDVKPSNLIIAADGKLKLMDFGIARSQRELATVNTAAGTGWGTPAYMSPEQIRAVDAETEVGSAADIYSLCATFYELFTKKRLYDHDSESAEIVRTSKLKGIRPKLPRAIVEGLPWELETILLGGLEHEVTDRYRSMADLKRDLRHFLNDEPIEYRRPSIARRLRLAYRRNRRIAQLAGAFLIVGAVGLFVYIRDVGRERDQANASFRNARTAVDDVFTQISEETLLNQPGTLELRRTLLEKVTNYYGRFIALRGDSPELQDELGLTKFRIGRLTEGIESPERALVHHLEARRIQASLVALTPEHEKRRRALGDTLNALGRNYQQLNQVDDAEAAYREAVEVRERLAKDFPDDIEYRRVWANALMNLGLLRQHLRNDYEGASDLLEKAQQVRMATVPVGPAGMKLERDRAGGYFAQAELGVVQAAVETDPKRRDKYTAKTVESFTLALKAFADLTDRYPTELDLRFRLAKCYVNVGLFQEDSTKKEECYLRALDIMNAFVLLNPNVAEYLHLHGLTLLYLGSLRNANDGIRDLEDAEASLSRLVKDHDDWRYRCDLATTLRELGLRGADPAKKKDDLERSLSLLKQLHGEFPGNSHVEQELSATTAALSRPAATPTTRTQ